MTERELSRYEVIKSLIAKKINGTDAAKQIGTSVRQVKRMKARVVKSGAEGLLHLGRGRDGNRKLDADILEKAKSLLMEKYFDFGPTFAAEKLDEDDGIKISKETVRGIMSNLELWKIKPRKQPKARHSWRPRRGNYGEMEQFDGSYHVWFGPEESCLLLSVDDATGKITHGRFGYNEGVAAVFRFWWDYAEKNGLPLSIYLDKFSTYKINHKNAVDNKEMATQFQRAMGRLSVQLITAHSPEAKGRIERMFETLQDRLVKELRLKGIAAIEEANKFLAEFIPKFNAKFAVVPQRRSDLHKKLSKQAKDNLPRIFSVQSERKVNNDYTVMFKNRYFQLDQTQPTTVYKKDAVIIEEHLCGSTKISLRNHYLNYRELPARPKKKINIKLPAIAKAKQSHWKPPLNHPWRQYALISRKMASVQNSAPNKI